MDQDRHRLPVGGYSKRLLRGKHTSHFAQNSAHIFCILKIIDKQSVFCDNSGYDEPPHHHRATNDIGAVGRLRYKVAASPSSFTLVEQPQLAPQILRRRNVTSTPASRSRT